MSRKFVIILFVAFLLISGGAVRAESLEITGNGAGSTNGITVQGTNTTTNTQNNTTNFQNNVKAKADTGGNSASGNSGDSTIVTGDANVSVTIKNQGGSNTAQINGCCGSPTPKPTKTPTPNPTGTPTNPPSNGGNGGGGTGGGNGGGSSSGGTGGDGGSNPQILGLSKTSGNGLETYLLYASGLICLGLGGKFLARR